MSTSRGLIRGFLAGVVFTTLGALFFGYLFYQRLQQRISSEGIAETAAKRIGEMTGAEVRVGSGEFNLPNLVTLQRVHLSDAHGPIVSAEKMELLAQGGPQAVEDGRFSKIVLTNPVLNLERRGENWNLTEFLGAFTARPAATEPQSDSGKGPTLPLTALQVIGLKLTVTLAENQVYSGIEADELTATRKDAASPWTIVTRGGRIRLNPSAEEWPLYEALGLLREADIADAGAAATKEAALVGFTPPAWLENLFLEDTEIELVHPNQTLTIDGLAIRAEEFFKVLELRTEDSEKKNSSPEA